jgi:phosphinothricin acetyltransferase
MPAITIRPAVRADLPALTEIYNHYVVSGAVTFDLAPLTPNDRRGWFDEHDHETGPHRLLVAVAADGRLAGYATTSRWRLKAAYDTTVESTVYCHHEATGEGVGTALYADLFSAIAEEDVARVVAGITLPNPASVALHERFGFSPVGVFHEVGRKFDTYWDVAWFERPAVLSMNRADGALR